MEEVIEKIHERIKEVVETNQFAVSEILFEIPAIYDHSVVSRVYLGRFGEGQTPIIIFVDNREAIQLGTQQRHIRRMTDDEIKTLFLEFYKDEAVIISLCKTYKDSLRKYFDKMKLKVHLYDDKEKEGILEALKELNDDCGIFYTINFKEEELKKINFTQEELNILREAFITNGFSVDPMLKFAFESGILVPNSGLIESADLMKYNDNQIIFTNTKTGKSSIAERLGLRVESSTTANLLGFATADSENPGLLHLYTKSFSFDEITAEKGMDLLSKLLSLMEQGKITVAKGRRALICETWSTFRFMGNPQENASEEIQLFSMSQEEYLANTFTNMLEKITTNVSAFGSRVALLIYNTELQIAKGRGFKDKTRKKLAELIEIIREITKDNYTKLYEEDKVQEFLNEPCSEDYAKMISDISNEFNVINSSRTKEFINGHIGAYRHINGMAFKLALCTKLENLIYNNIDIEEVLEIAREKRAKIQEINASNFSNLKKSVADQFRVKIASNRFKSLDEIRKRFVCAIKDLDNGDYALDEIPTEKLNNIFMINNRSKNEILNRLSSNIERTNDELKSFGILLYIKDKTKRFIKNCPIELNKIIEESKEIKQETLKIDTE